MSQLLESNKGLRKEIQGKNSYNIFATLLYKVVCMTEDLLEKYKIPFFFLSPFLNIFDDTE